MKKTVLLSIFFIITSFNFFVGAQENPVNWTFKSVKVNDSVAELQFAATIQEKWHLYAQSHNNGIEIPLEFTFKPGKEYSLLGKVKEPKPTAQYDPVFDDTSRFFTKKVIFKQKVQIKSSQPFVIKGKLSGQACIDGRCVAIERKYSFNIEGFDKVAMISGVDESVGQADSNSKEQLLKSDVTEEKSTENVKAEESLFMFFIFSFLGGLVGLLMPCVFPMIPMTISFFMKSKKHPKLDALIYGISIVLIYVVFGIILSVIFGADFANIISTHWIPNILFAAIFIVFAISLFGYFEIALPSKWVNKSSKMESTGGFFGIFFMALTLVLVSFSCTLPIAGAVALNSAGGSLFKPIIGMLGFSLGIAIPFTLFAFFPGMLKNLPKSGGWMNTLKVVLAFVELAFALKFLNVPDQTYHWGILDREVYLSFWIVIFSMLGFYLIGKIRFPLDNEMPVQKSWFRFILSIFVFTFVIYMIPGMFGAPLKAISGWLPPMTTQDFDVNKIVREESGNAQVNTIQLQDNIKYGDRLEIPHGIKGYFDYDQALRVAKEQNKPLFIDFTGHGCVNCRNVENAVWIDKKVRDKFAENFIVAALYVDDKNIKLATEDQILDLDGEKITTLGSKNMFIQNTKYKENSQPCYFIVDVDGSVLAGPIHYELNVEKYLEFLDSGIKAFKEKHSNQ